MFGRELSFVSFFLSRFQLYYFSDADHKKEERKETVLTIDTRNISNGAGGSDQQDNEFDENVEPPVQKAIQTKLVLYTLSSF